MIIKGESLVSSLSNDYSSPYCKLGRMVEKGEIIRLKRGVYETDPNTPPYLVAHEIYGPSYVSFEFALSWYNIIPERVNSITCATFGKHRTRRFTNPLGRFVYRDIPEAVFSLGIRRLDINGRELIIATPEKAVCDKLCKMPPTLNYIDLEALMFEDLRFDEDEIDALDRDTISTYSELYGSSTVRTLSRYLATRAR